MKDSSKKEAPTIRTSDITIIGAGMVGSSIACGLADAGYQVTIVDKYPAPEFSSADLPHIRVSALSYASENFLQQLGAWNHILEMRSCPYRQLAVWEKVNSALISDNPNERTNQTIFDAQQVNKSHLGHIVENDITQLALHHVMETKQHIDFICNASIAQVEHKEDQIVAQLNDGSQIQSKLLIGADGALSKVRELSNIGLTSDQYQQQAMVITVAHEGPQQAITWQAFTPTGPLAYLPLPSGEETSYGSLVWYNHPENIHHLKQLEDQALIAEIQKTFPAELPRLTQIIEKGSFPLVKRHAQSYGKPRVILVGDAAHTINPLAGQGVNLGFQDAMCLIENLQQAKQLNNDPGALSILKNYERTRRPANSQMMLLMDMFYHTFSNDIAPLKAIRNIGLHFAERTPWAKKKVLKYAMGIN